MTKEYAEKVVNFLVSKKYFPLKKVIEKLGSESSDSSDKYISCLLNIFLGNEMKGYKHYVQIHKEVVYYENEEKSVEKNFYNNLSSTSLTFIKVFVFRDGVLIDSFVFPTEPFCFRTISEVNFLSRVWDSFVLDRDELLTVCSGTFLDEPERLPTC